MEEKDYLEHYVDIDNMMELKLKIPKRLDPLELKALMVKTDKLFKLSEVTIDRDVGEVKKTTRNYVKKNNKASYNIWTEDMTKSAVVLKELGIKPTRIAEKLNEKYKTDYFNNKNIWAKFAYLKRKNEYDSYVPKEKPQSSEKTDTISVEDKKQNNNRLKLFSEDMVNTIVVRVEMGDDVKSVRDFVNNKYETSFSRSQINNKINYLKKKGEIKK